MRGLLPVLLFFMLLTTAQAARLVGKPAPVFAIRDLAGGACSLEDHKGHPVLLKIGTTWCPSCAAQSEELVKALPELEKLEVGIIEVFVEDTEEAVAEYRAKHKLPAAVRTCLDKDGQVLADYSVVSIPRVVILDADHAVVSDQYLIPAQRLVESFRPLAVPGK